MGEVYVATDRALERTVAVKLLAERYAREKDARARFQREAQAAARLSAAPNVVTVYDVAEHDGRPLIVMEYLSGGTVHQRLESGRVSDEQALTWLEQAATALDRAHASGVVHRDVKPANLLLDDEGNVHVSDFGIASTSGAATLTAPGTVLGTVGYLSPEQARGEPATPSSDRYSLAVVAFELLTGRRPFAADTPITEAFAHVNAPIPSATALDPALPPSIDAVFRDALAKDPGSRPASALELVARLRRALEGGEPIPAPTLVDPAPTTRRPVYRSRRRRGSVAALVAAGLLVAGLGVAALLKTSDDSGRRQAATATTDFADGTSAPESTVAAEDGEALANQGFALMQAGDYSSALPLLRQAVVALKSSGSLTEAYASYNLAYSRFAVGQCGGVSGLLDRSERIQGHRDEIDALRAQWQARCAPGTTDEDQDAKPEKGHGRSKGYGDGNG
jgi:serine/threonine protein kinase